MSKIKHLKTQIDALDKVLGGGLVPGSAYLLGGARRAGKSTLLIQMCSNLRSFYATGEMDTKMLVKKYEDLLR